jgi:hypothetical protein
MVLKPNVTRRAIQRILAAPDEGTGEPVMVNPETGRPWSLGTIQADVEAIKAQWRESAVQEVGDFVARSLATLDELQELAWRQENGELILKVEARRAQLLGLNKPSAANVGFEDGVIQIKVQGGDNI